MTSGEEAAAGMRRILRLAPDCDPTTLSLSAEEGFLLSRIDGHTSWRLLREIGGIEPDEADLCLEGWIASGYVKVAGMAPEASRPRPARARSAANAPPKPGTATTPGPIDESLIDAGLDLEVEVQRKILEFEAGLGRSYHDLLGVKPDADTKQVKRAYFKLSKEFHPDRYFRREIGGYAARLDAIFKRVLEAYEILSDPKLCAELAEQGVEAGGSAEAGGGAETGAAPQAEPPPQTATPAQPSRPLTKLERLKQRMPFRIPESVLAERRQKAEEFARAAEVSAHRGNFQEAASSIRIAITFDPHRAELRAQLAELQAKSAERRAKQLLEQFEGSAGLDSEALEKASKLLEDVLLYRPHDPKMNDQAAQVAVRLGKIEDAFEYASLAIEHCPNVASYHSTMGAVYRAQGDLGHAKKEFETAVRLDPDDAVASKELASARIGRAASQGG